jgi:hypothetical protein
VDAFIAEHTNIDWVQYKVPHGKRTAAALANPLPIVGNNASRGDVAPQPPVAPPLPASTTEPKGEFSICHALGNGF